MSLDGVRAALRIVANIGDAAATAPAPAATATDAAASAVAGLCRYLSEGFGAGGQR